MSQTQTHTSLAYAPNEAPKPPTRRCFKTAVPTAQYLAAVKQLYHTNLGRLLEAAHAFNSDLRADEAQDSVASLARYLKDYRDNIDDDVFIRWGCNSIKTDVTTKVAYRLHKRAVFAGIWRVLYGCTDLGISPDTAENLASNVWLWVIQNASSLAAPDQPASIPTRLRKLGYFQARAWKTRQLRQRGKHPSTMDELTDREDLEQTRLNEDNPTSREYNDVLNSPDFNEVGFDWGDIDESEFDESVFDESVADDETFKKLDDRDFRDFVDELDERGLPTSPDVRAVYYV